MNKKAKEIRLESIVAFKLNVVDKNYYESIAKKEGISLSALIRNALSNRFDYKEAV